ncbi:MAG TPA: ATP-binding protein [Burkholderiales bacterium]
MQGKFLSQLTRVAHLAYALTAALAAMALWGWALDIPRLRDLGADFAPMSAPAALAFILLAAGFVAAERGRRGTAVVASALVALIAGAAGIEALLELPVDMGISVVGSISLVLLALVTPLPRNARAFGISLQGTAAALVGATAFFALLGLSLRVLRFDIAAPRLGFSAPGALAAMFAAVGIAAARPTPWLLDTLYGRRTAAVVTRWLLPAAFIVPLAVGWTRLAAEREGVFGEAVGMTLFTTVMIVAFGALILWVANTLEHLERQRAQAEVQAGESREWLQVTLAAIGDGVIATDRSGRVRFLNAAAQRLTGWRAAEAAGLPIEELLHLFDERNGQALPNPLNTSLKTRGSVTAAGEPALRARDGKVHPVHVNAAPIVDADDEINGAVLVLREAAAQRQAERAMREAYTELDERVVRRTAALERASSALRERNALLHAITTSTPDLIFAKDRDGRMLMSNPAWLKAVGAAASETRGLDDNERLVMEAGETMTLEETHSGPDGDHTYLATKSPLRDEQGRVIGLIGVATDITERKQAQRELEKLVVAEQRLRAEAERANRAKDEFLAIVSHELRSPLNALRGWSHLMATSKPLEPQLIDRAAKAIKRNVDHQTRLIDDLLDTSRIVSGKLTIERRAVNLVEIVLAALDAARPGAAAKEIDLRFTPDDANIMVVGDGGRMQQLASNLLSNAVKFTPERGAIAVRLLKNGDRVQLQVKDNGIGIAPEFLPHVFDRFTQADTSAARRAGGLGIGLALVRHIALLHGGQVRADSPGVGRGSTFTVELPAAPANLARPVQAPERVSAQEGALSGMRVWVLDDDHDAHEVVTLTLRQTGAVVEAFSSAGELAAQLERVLPDRGPDVFLVDLAMPGEDGFEALRRIRSLEMASGADRYIPAIAMTAFTQVEREKLLAAGFFDRVDKPVDAEKLIAGIRLALAEKRRGAMRAA